MVFMALVALFSGCSSEDVITDSVKRDNLALTVSQENFAGLDSVKTRTTDSGTSTTFSSGDAIGIYVVNGSTVTNANLKYTYNGSGWSNDTYGANVPFVPGGKYFAYYPYKDTYDASSVTSSATTADDFFANVISGWDPGTDQSTHALYTAKDLMVSEATVNASTGYTFSMAHQMALMEMDFAQIRWGTNDGKIGYKYRFDSYSPLDMGGGKYRLLVKPSSAVVVAGKVYTSITATNQAWYISETSPAKANYKVYTLGGATASLTDNWDAVNVGDIYYSDGSWSSTYNSAKTAIGVVVSTNGTYCESGKGYGHGLVMSLKNVSTSAMWNNANTPDISGLTNVQHVNEWYSDYSGIANCNVVKAITGYSSTTYPAFYLALNSTVTTPSGSSGWFLPSSGQWYKALEETYTYYNNNSGSTVSMTLSSKETITDALSYSFSGESAAGVTVLNYAMSGHSLTSSLYDTYATSTYYWTSSECNINNACDLIFYSSSLALNYDFKANSYRVRPFLAF